MKKSLCIVTLLFLAACARDKGVPPPHRPTPADLEIPHRFPAVKPSAENPLTREGIELGRSLYFDDILSSNGLSCSSCHAQELSFSRPLFTTASGEKKSVPPHVNLAWNPDYNWNGSEPNLDVLCLGDFGPEFFNTDMNVLVNRIRSHPKYPRLFFRAFGIADVGDLSHDELQLKIVYAISQFMRTLVSADSKLDRWIRRETEFTPSEMRGFEIFFSERGDCFHCHGYPLMTDNQFHNTGLDLVPANGDRGRYVVTGNPADMGKFSSPTLRNIAQTAPYMHDGRFNTLEEVIDFYDSGVHFGAANLDPLMTKSFKQYGLSLSTQQKTDLVNFLKTLTDSAFITNKAFSKP